MDNAAIMYIVSAILAALLAVSECLGLNTGPQAKSIIGVIMGLLSSAVPTPAAVTS
jgi:hypothetical protein